MSEPLRYHPLANIFPLIEGEEFDALVADIKANGLQEAITLHEDGTILDGRNRYRASLAAGVDARMEMFHGADPLAFVISKNLKRRHLNESQRAMVAARLATMRQGERTDLKPSANLPKVDQDAAAQVLKVSPRLVRSAKVVQEKATPELARAVDQGLTGVIIEKRDAVHVMLAHDGTQTLHYVDPPYLPETRSPASKYDLKYRMYRHELSAEDHAVLLASLLNLDGMVILSGYAAPLYDEALNDWRRVETEAHADGARPRTEVLWINPQAAAALDAARAQSGLFDGAAA